MSDIKLGTDTIVLNTEHITKSVEAAVAGFERAKKVIEGINDNLLLWTNYSESWQKKIFDLRVNEIEHLRNLGRISAKEEAQLWKELFDEKKYGWKNVQQAQENYYKCLFENAKRQIEEQTALGKLSAREIADAWKEVYRSFDDVNIKYQAALEIRNLLLNDADESTMARRKDSDRWMARQSIYDGGDAANQINAYSRRIEAEKQLLKEIEGGFLNGVELGAVEQDMRWREVYEYIEELEDERYKTANSYLREQIDTYVSESKSALDEMYNYRLGLYNDELAALNDKYREEQRQRRSARREEELDELLTLKGHYKNAVTAEGQQRYKDILSKISDIYYEQQDEDDRSRYEEKKQKIRGSIAQLNDEYKNSLKQLEESKNSILRQTGDIALKGIETAAAASGSISNIMLDINRAFSAQVEGVFNKTQQCISEQVSKIAALFQSLERYSAAYGGGGADTNVSVTLNDYGDKNLSGGVEGVEGYANEFLSILRNALRSRGVK